MNFFDKIDRIIAKLEEFIMAIGIILMAINTMINVISRFGFNHSIIFAEELNSIFILLVTFAGIGYAARHGRHIRMSAFYDAFNPRVRKVFMTVITLVTAIFMIGLAWYSLVYIEHLYQRGRIYPALAIPIYISYIWVPIGFLITGIQYFLTFIKNLSNQDIYLSTNLREQEAQEVEV